MNLKPQEVLQIFMFERLVERLSVSKYKENFILKGGLLIASMIGIAERTTMDLDTTIQGLPMTEEEMERIVREILAIDVEDGIYFEYQGMQPIREDDEYNNFCVSICAMYEKMKIPMKIDITTGDKITPRQIDYDYKFMFEDKSVLVKAYTLETIIAEKYETVIRRNIVSGVNMFSVIGGLSLLAHYYTLNGIKSKTVGAVKEPWQQDGHVRLHQPGKE